MSEETKTPALDRIGKLGPVVVLTLAMFGCAVAWGSNQTQLAAIAKQNDRIGDDIRKLADSVATLTATSTGHAVLTQVNKDAITSIDGRVRQLELASRPLPR
jgi:hypothetical protein